MYDNKTNNAYLMMLVSAIFVSLIFNLFIRNEMDFSYLVLDLNDMGNLSIQSKKDVMQYILMKRLKQFLIIVVIFKAFGYEKVFNILIVICGGIIGLMVSSQVYYLGLFGLAVLMIYLFPHYVLYFFGIYYGFKMKLFYAGTDDAIKKFFFFSLIFIIGVIFECSFMTFFLKNFYQYMVS